MRAVTRDAVLSLSERYRAVPLSLAISASLDSNSRYEAIGVRIEASITAMLPLTVLETVFMKGVSEGVMEGQTKSRFIMPDDGRDLQVLVEQFKLSIPLDDLTDEELRKLGQQAKALAADCTKELLDNLGE